MSKIEVDAIVPQSGTNLTVGEAGDTITVPSGATFDASNATTTLPATVVTTDGSQTLTNKTIDASQLTGTITPSDNTVSLAKLTATGTKDSTTFLRGDNTFASAGGSMTPAFMATNVTGQGISDNVLTKVTLTNERLDTDSCYDNSTNYRFTPTVAGKYYCFGNVSFNSGADGNLLEFAISLYKNGAYSTYDYRDIRSNPASYTNYLNTISIIDFNGTTDYLELYVLANISTGATTLDGSTSIDYARFGAFKIIE